MKITAVVVSALLAGIASAQYSGLPSCAVSCVNDNLPQSCNLDPICICKFPNFIDNISCCISKSTCGPSEVEEALKVARTICSGADITLPSAAGCSGAAATGSPSSTGSSSGSPSSTGNPSSTSASAGAATTTPGSSGIKLNVNGMGLAGAVLGAVALL